MCWYAFNSFPYPAGGSCPGNEGESDGGWAHERATPTRLCKASKAATNH